MSAFLKDHNCVVLTTFFYQILPTFKLWKTSCKICDKEKRQSSTSHSSLNLNGIGEIKKKET